MKNLANLLRKKIVILDGASGTELQKRGLPKGANPEVWCLKNQDVLRAVHADYAAAGADIIYTCTFGANRIKLDRYGIKNARSTNKKLAQLARRAVGRDVLVAGDIGPTGKFVEPMGPISFEDAVGIFKEQAQGLLDGGVDLFVIETMMDIQETRAALIAVKELTKKFTIVTMTYEKDGRTLNGTDPVTALITLQSLGADAVGCNCSTGPEKMVKIINSMKPYATVPLVAKPNAGIPKLMQGKTIFDMAPKDFASYTKEFVTKGANMLGGCCGTTPSHISELKKKAYGEGPVLPRRKSLSALSSPRKHIILEGERPLVVVGECINPTGKKTLGQELREEKMSLVRYLAKEQESNGANLLDINVGLPDINEKKILVKAINLLAGYIDLPLVIDSARNDAIEASLRVYPGRALINSISGDEKKLKELLPIAKKYGAMFILLPLDEKGVPHKFNERKKIIKKILKRAQRFGFSKDDIVVDGLVMAVSSNPSASVETIKTVLWCSKTLKTNTIVGLSNISFGMPERTLINTSYLTILQSNGLSMAIANPLDAKTMNIKMATDALIKNEKDVLKFINKFKKKQKSTPKISIKNQTDEQKIYNAILEGNKEDIRGFVQKALENKINANKLVYGNMIPAINKVGDLFDKKEYFLPQLISSAEAMKIAFEYLEPYLTKGGISKTKKTVIILATVKDDIHDIGKNIVSLILKNHGFSVIDLGKDVSAQKIIKEIKRHKAPIVGLSALMTTTMVSMKTVIDLAKKQRLNCRFIVGGAVVTESYAHSIGAQYAHTGVDAVRMAKKLGA